jgi:hypothetical protein
MSEWLRSVTRNHMGSARTGSNPVVDGVWYFLLVQVRGGTILHRFYFTEIQLMRVVQTFMQGQTQMNCEILTGLPPNHTGWVKLNNMANKALMNAWSACVLRLGHRHHDFNCQNTNIDYQQDV